jgi:hypothetical protein
MRVGYEGHHTADVMKPSIASPRVARRDPATGRAYARHRTHWQAPKSRRADASYKQGLDANEGFCRSRQRWDHATRAATKASSIVPV